MNEYQEVEGAVGSATYGIAGEVTTEDPDNAHLEEAKNVHMRRSAKTISHVW